MVFSQVKPYEEETHFIPGRVIKNMEQLQEYQRESIAKHVNREMKVPQYIKNKIIERIDPFLVKSKYGTPSKSSGYIVGPIFHSHVRILMEYGLIEVPINDDSSGDNFKRNIEWVKGIHRYQRKFHGTQMILLGKEGTHYAWGEGSNRVHMKSIMWNKKIKEACEYVQQEVEMNIEKVMVCKYQKKEKKKEVGQPCHCDRNSGGGITQLVDVSIGEERTLEIKYKYINHTYEITLREGYMYIFTHAFNKYF